MFNFIGYQLKNVLISSCCCFSAFFSSYFCCTVYSLFVKPFSWVVLTFIIGQLLTMIISTCKIAFLTIASENLNHSLALAKDTLQNYQVLKKHKNKFDQFMPKSNYQYLVC